MKLEPSLTTHEETPAAGPVTACIECSPHDPALYSAVIGRRSVRRYDGRVVPEDTRWQVAEFALRIEPLVAENEFGYSVLPIVGKSEELAAVMGGYGRMVSAPHLILPRIRGEKHVLEDFGFRVQQLVTHLTQLGLGSCYVAALGHEAEALDKFDSPRGERIPAVVVFGYPAASAAGRGFNTILRSAIGADRPLPFSKFTFARAFGTAAGLTPLQEMLFDALRHAPSAGNSRPWRVVLRGGLAYLAVKLDTPYYRIARATRLGYHRLDAGIGVANISLGLRAFDRSADWKLLADDPEVRTKLGLPPNHELIASIPFPESGLPTRGGSVRPEN